MKSPKEPFQYAVANDIIQQVDAEIVAKLPELYPDPKDRLIIERVLLPQFRLELNTALGKFKSKKTQTLKTKEIDNLCKEYDSLLMSESFQKKVDARTRLKPVLELIEGLRPQIKQSISEEFLTEIRAMFASAGLTSHASLMSYGPYKFVRLDFSPYGKGIAIANAILGESNTMVTSETLMRISKKLGFYSQESETQNFLTCLAENEINSHQDIMRFSGSAFRALDFPPYGKGHAFATAVLGEPVEGVTPEILERIAQTVGLPKMSPEAVKQGYIEKLAALGIHDYPSLMGFGIVKFQSAYFHPYGKGGAFIGVVLGRTVGNLSLQDLNDLADCLGWAKPEKRSPKKLLADNGIVDLWSLKFVGLRGFLDLDFGHYGNGRTFVKSVLGLSGQLILSVGHFEQLATELELPHMAQETKVKIRTALKEKSINCQASLRFCGVNNFKKMNFGEFGGARKFASAVLERTVRINKGALVEISETIELPEISEEAQSLFRTILIESGIPDRKTLYMLGAKNFRQKTLDSKRTGTEMATIILGRAVGKVRLRDLEEIAEAIDLPEVSEEGLEGYKSALASEGITDLASLYSFGTARFMSTSFPPYGMGRKFTALLFGDAQRTVTKETIKDIGTKLALPNLSEENVSRARSALMRNKITNRHQLVSFGTTAFVQADFPPFGKGISFASYVTCRIVPKVSIGVLHEIADVVGFERVEISDYEKLLVENKIPDRETLMGFGIRNLQKLDFGEYGKIGSFFGRILGQRVYNLNRDVLSAVADKLEW